MTGLKLYPLLICAFRPNKHRKVGLVFDTGSAITQVDTEFIDGIGYSARDAVHVSGVQGAVGGVQEGYVVRLAKLSVFGIDFQNLPVLVYDLHFPRKPIGEQAPADEISPPHLRGRKLPQPWVRPVGDVEITLPNSQGNQSFRSVAGKRSNGRAVYLGDPRLALLGRSPVGVEKSALTTPCPVAAGSVFSGKVQFMTSIILKSRGSTASWAGI